jgi:hypothetical protein
MSHKKFSSSLELLAPLKDFNSEILGLDVFAPLRVFVIARFLMAIVSSTAFNHSPDYAAKEMYKLLALSMFFVVSLNESMIEHSSSSSSCLIKISTPIVLK